MDLNKTNIIWSKGPIQDSYSQKETSYKASNIEIINIINNATKENNIIFIRNNINDLNFFCDNLNLLKIPVILITSDGDMSNPSCNNYIKIIKLLNYYHQI